MAEPSDQRRYSDWLSGNLVLLATLTLFLLMIMKVTRVAHLNVATAYAILSSTGPINVTLGTLTASLPLVLVAIESIVVLFFFRTQSKIGRSTTITALVFIVAVSTFVTPLYTTATLVVSLISTIFIAFHFRDSGPTMKRLQEKQEPRFGAVAIKVGAVGIKLEEARALRREFDTPAPNSPTVEESSAIADKRLAMLQNMEDRLADAEQALGDAKQALAASKKETRERVHSIMFWSATTALAPLLFLTLTSSTVWLPVEHFAMTDGTSVVGYSLRSDVDWHSVLIDTPRGVSHLRSKTISKREICRTGESNSIRPLADYITGRDATSPYASCDALKEDGN